MSRRASTSPSSDRLEVGRVGRPHGLTGQVTVVLVSNRPERRVAGAVLYADDLELSVVDARPHRDGWLFRFAGVTDRDGAEALRGSVLRADRLPAPERASTGGSADGPADAEDDTLWVHELVGARVVDVTGRAIGRVEAIQANPAHDLLVLDGGGLVPLPFVVSWAGGIVVIDPPDGLLE